MSETYKGYPLFNDVKSVNLRSWNRAAILHNMMEDGHSHIVEEYVEKLDKAAKMQCYIVLKLIVDKGVEAARKDILAHNTVQ